MSSEGYWWLYVPTGGGSCQSACSVHVTTPGKGKYFRACVGLGLLNGALGKLSYYLDIGGEGGKKVSVRYNL